MKRWRRCLSEKMKRNMGDGGGLSSGEEAVENGVLRKVDGCGVKI